jgi:hypothetical protein
LIFLSVSLAGSCIRVDVKNPGSEPTFAMVVMVFDPCNCKDCGTGIAAVLRRRFGVNPAIDMSQRVAVLEFTTPVLLRVEDFIKVAGESGHKLGRIQMEVVGELLEQNCALCGQKGVLLEMPGTRQQLHIADFRIGPKGTKIKLHGRISQALLEIEIKGLKGEPRFQLQVLTWRTDQATLIKVLLLRSKIVFQALFDYLYPESRIIPLVSGPFIEFGHLDLPFPIWGIGGPSLPFGQVKV